MVKDAKQRVRAFWNANPCGTINVSGQSYLKYAIGSPEFFMAFDAYRQELYPYLPKILNYAAYKSKRVLEIGSGLGVDAKNYSLAGANIVVSDLSDKSLRLVKKRFGDAELKGQFVVEDAENIPFKNASFDLVYSIGVLHHTPDTQQAIDEIRRILKPKGKAIIMLYYASSLRLKIRYQFDRFFTSGFKGLTREEYISKRYDGLNNPLGKAYSKQDIRCLFKKFSAVKTEIHNFDRSSVPLVKRILTSLLPVLEKLGGLDIYVVAEK